jgi:hypothetical protein
VLLAFLLEGRRAIAVGLLVSMSFLISRHSSALWRLELCTGHHGLPSSLPEVGTVTCHHVGHDPHQLLLRR